MLISADPLLFPLPVSSFSHHIIVFFLGVLFFSATDANLEHLSTTTELIASKCNVITDFGKSNELDYCVKDKAN